MIDFEKILAAKGKNKADLARFLEIDPQNVGRTIRNPKIMFSKFESICRFCGISVIDALRLSGYDDTPGSVDPDEFINLASEAFAAELNKLFMDKKIAPYKALEDKDKEIIRLNNEITKLKEAGR